MAHSGDVYHYPEFHYGGLKPEIVTFSHKIKIQVGRYISAFGQDINEIPTKLPGLWVQLSIRID